MRRLIEFFVDRPLVVNSIMVMVCVFGVATFMSMSRDLIPTFRSDVIEIRGTLPGASATDTEQFVTFPIEEAIQDLPSIKKTESKTSAGTFRVRVVFRPGTEDLADALETMRTRIEQLRHRLPSDLQPVSIKHLKSDQLSFMDVVLRPVDVGNPVHRKWVKSFEDHLDKIPHIVGVESSMERRDLYIEFDQKKIDATGINVGELRQRILEFLEYQPIGIVDSNFDRISVELAKGFDDLKSLEQLPIRRNRVGKGPSLSDVAAVQLQSVRQRRVRKMDGKDYVELTLNKDTGSDIVDLEKKIQEEIDELNARFPDGIQASVSGSAGFLVERPLKIIMKNGLAGLVLVGVILFLFLGFRISSMAVIGLPFVYLGTFIILDALGIQIHLVSIIGMILVLGILVDDAILVSERFTELLQTGLPAREAAITAASRLFRPVTGTIITNIVVFLPILVIDSELGEIFYAVPCVVIATLSLSLFESFFLLPNHLQHFIPSGYQFRERRLFLAMQRFYRSFLSLALKLRYLSVLFFVALLGLAIFLVTKMEKDFNLMLGTKNVFVRAIVKESESLEDTFRQVDELRKVVAKLPNGSVMYTVSTAGEAITAGGHHVQGLREGEIKITVNERHEDPQALADEVEAHLKELLKAREGDFEKLTVHQRRSAQQKEDDIVTIYVSGGDTLSFEEIQDEVKETITKVKNVKRIFMDPDRFQKSWQFQSNPEQLALYGVDLRNLTRQLREYFAPQELLRMRFKGDQITVYTRFSHTGDLVYGELQDLTIMTPRGIPVPLEALGKWRERSILREIEHRDLLRKFEVDVRYDKESVATEEIQDELESALETLRETYPQYYFSVKPPEEIEEAKKWMVKVVVGCVGLIYLTLILVLGSLSLPLLVMFSIPFGFTGVVLALQAHGMPLGLMSMIGLVGLAGVVVNDSLVMVDTINNTRRAHPGLPYREVILQGASTRFKAVILTSLTTLGGVFPLAYGLGGKAGFTQPMVFALGWGLLFATLLTLILLPSSMAILDDLKCLLRFLAGKVLRRRAKGA